MSWTGIGITTTDATTGRRIAANVHAVDSTGAIYEFATMVTGPGIDAGFARWGMATGAATLTISAAGYATRTVQRDIPGDTNANYALTAVALPRPTKAQQLAVAANFCNIYCADGVTPMFTDFLPKADEQGRFDEWLDLQIAAGSTHLTYSPFGAYRDYMGGGFNWLDQPDRFADLTRRVTLRASQSGVAMTPILFLDDGGPDPRPRIDRYWPPIAQALRAQGVIDRCFIVPAWEPVKGDWTSADLSYALQRIHEWFPECLMGWHGSPDRWVGSSNPLEPDDPWQGAESDFWKSHGGEYLDICFYQTQADAVFSPNCNPEDDSCWLNRWTDGVMRLGNGLNGWRIVPICLAEGPAYSFIREQSTPAQAREWATSGRDLAASYGVTVSYMNGLPY